MAKLQDGSERIRIKVEVANKVREMSNGLNMSFLEVLYYAVNTFYHHHYLGVKPPKNQSSPTVLEIEKATVTEPISADSDDTCELDFDI